MENNCQGNCQNCNCQNQNNGPSPKEIGDFIKEVAGVVVKLKDGGIISQETIDHANHVAITALDKVQEILQNIDAKKVADGNNNNNNNNNNNPMPTPMPPINNPMPMPVPMPMPEDPKI